MGDPFDSKKLVCVCWGPNLEPGVLSLSGDHKGDGIVSCFGPFQEPPSCDSPRPGLDKSCPDYLPIYLVVVVVILQIPSEASEFTYHLVISFPSITRLS